MNIRIPLSIALVVVLAACAPQAELVKTRTDVSDLRGDVKSLRDQFAEMRKRVDRLEPDVTGATDLQKNLADYGVRFDQIGTDLQILQGKIEENNYRLSELSQKLDDQGFKLAELAARVEELEKSAKSAALAEAGKPAPSAKEPEPSDVYRQAKGDYDSGNFDLAIAGFENYLKKFPTGSQADAAQYWIGESLYAKKEYGKAIEAFSKLLKAHPKSEKAPAAQLKIGYSYQNEKNSAKAREHLNKVIKSYPQSKEASLARDRLKKLEKP